MASISINGKTYSGNNVVVKNNKVYVDGDLFTDDVYCKQINVNIVGNIIELDVDSCDSITVNGTVGSVITSSGDVIINGDVNGGVSTKSGDVNCGNVNGTVSTISGDINRG